VTWRKSTSVSYTNECSGRTFVHYIAQGRRQELAKKVVGAQFFSLLIDGSTDKLNIDNKVLTLWCNSNGCKLVKAVK